MRVVKFSLTLIGLLFVNFLIFEGFFLFAERVDEEKHSHNLAGFFAREYHSWVGYLAESSLVRSLSEYIHTRSPLLDHIPYSSSSVDIRLSTWHLPPHQVVLEWFAFVPLFVGSLIALGSPSLVFVETPVYKKLNFVLLQLSLWTFAAIVHFKLRAWFELGEWFALQYLLQPCHVLVFSYIVLSLSLVRDGLYVSKRSVGLFHVLWDLQWGSWVALVFPDTAAMEARNYYGETFLFYFEHFLLIALPLVFGALIFPGARHPSRRDTLVRAWISWCWFGLHHIQVMTPLSLASGVQINYQTHLPENVMNVFQGRWYKWVIAALGLVACVAFAAVLEPAWRKLVTRAAKNKSE